MANLTGNYDAVRKPGTLIGYNVKAGETIHKGALVAADEGGWLVKAGDTANRTFLGVAYEPGYNASGQSGDVGVRVEKGGSYVFHFTGVWNQTIIGKKVYAKDDCTVALAENATNDLYIGDVVALVTGSKVRVRIDRAVG